MAKGIETVIFPCQQPPYHCYGSIGVRIVIPFGFFLHLITINEKKANPFAPLGYKERLKPPCKPVALIKQLQSILCVTLGPRRLGGTIGMVGILHTWGRNLSYHPHVHYLVPAGAWDGTVWRYGRHKRFFLPVSMLSILFRAKFRDALKCSDCFAQIPAAVWAKDWVVHCQPVGRGKRALTYLAAYVFRVALSHRRLVSGTDTAVTFRYRPSGSQQWRLSTLAPMSFMHRFLQHVLPKGFVKVRYYGFFSPGQRQTLAQICDFLTPYHPHTATLPETGQGQSPTVHSWQRCPNCGQPLHLTKVVTRFIQPWRPP